MCENIPALDILARFCLEQVMNCATKMKTCENIPALDILARFCLEQVMNCATKMKCARISRPWIFSHVFSSVAALYEGKKQDERWQQVTRELIISHFSTTMSSSDRAVISHSSTKGENP